MTIMHRALFLTLVFVLSVMSPLAGAATTETQFKDGTTSYEHTFSQKGVGPAGVVALPIGAEVQSATFNLLGEASTTTYTNFTTDAHYGGAGDTDYTSSSTSSPSPFTYARRDNFEVDSQTVSLKGPRTNPAAGQALTSPDTLPCSSAPTAREAPAATAGISSPRPAPIRTMLVSTAPQLSSALMIAVPPKSNPPPQRTS